MSFLKVKNLESGYGRTSILYDINIEVNEGEIVAIVGPNGAGKTTLLRTISGILKVKKGQIGFQGIEVVADYPHPYGNATSLLRQTR